MSSAGGGLLSSTSLSTPPPAGNVAGYGGRSHSAQEQKAGSSDTSPLELPLLEEGERYEGPAEHSRPKARKLSLAALTLMLYFSIGVPFGAEAIVAASGPFGCAIGFFVVLPLLWQIPICMVTAEMAAAFSHDHTGSVAWVHAAFGPFWALVDSQWSLLTSLGDMALYPLIIIDYVGLQEGVWRWTAVYMLILCLSLMAYRGADVVGKAEEWIFGLIILPFVVLVLWGLPQVQWRQFAPGVGIQEVDWHVYVQVLFWTSTFWQKTASLAPETKDCAKNFPRGIFAAAVLQALINGVIHCVAAGAMDPTTTTFSDWSPGYLKVAADTIVGGLWLGRWITVVAALGNCGAYLSEITITSEMMLGMAEKGILPAPLKRQSYHGTPSFCLVAIALIIAAIQPLDFQNLVALCNFMYCMQTLMELAAFSWLRYSQPDLHRPFQLPLGPFGLVAIVLLPTAVLTVVLLEITSSAAVLAALTVITSVPVACACLSLGFPPSWVRLGQKLAVWKGPGPSGLHPKREMSLSPLKNRLEGGDERKLTAQEPS
ncbi:unnamed protein product [Chrysoparadoxa australica]